MAEMTSDVDESIARAMETNIRLLPVLPDLLTDLWELGTSSEQIVSAFQSVGVDPWFLVLDLGCGKGAVAVALAERLGLRIEAIVIAGRSLGVVAGMAVQDGTWRTEIRQRAGR